MYNPSKVIDKLLYLVFPITKKEAQYSESLFGQNISQLGVVLCPIYQLTGKAALWGLKQEKALQQVQAAVHITLPFEPYDSAQPMVLVVSVAHKNFITVMV